jgi:hypothetical protein
MAQDSWGRSENCESELTMRAILTAAFTILVGYMIVHAIGGMYLAIESRLP